MTSIFLFLLLDFIHTAIPSGIKDDTTDLIVHCGQMWLKQTICNQPVAKQLNDRDTFQKHIFLPKLKTFFFLFKLTFIISQECSF